MKTPKLALGIALVTAAACASGPRLPEPPLLDANNSDGGAVRDTSSVEQGRAPEVLLLRGGRMPGGEPVDVEIRSGKIVAVQPTGTRVEDPLTEVVDLTGRWLAPGFIDSHVHLTYLPVSDELVRGGVIAAVDLAAPESSLSLQKAPLRLLGSGPMITAVNGYPLDSWGSDGYGVACKTVQDAVAAVDRLIDAGAGLIKLPLGQGSPLPESVARAAITRAHERGRNVAVHALNDAAAAQGARLGADVLAHTPVERLTPSTIEAWRGRAVISTLGAFGGTAATLANLASLRAAGVTVIYGTDLGNTRDARIDPRELDFLARVGLDGAALIEAATAAPARLWGWDDLGSIAVGKTGSLLVLDADPTADPATLARPVHVIVDGKVIR